MKFLKCLAIVAGLFAAPVMAQDTVEPQEPVEVMILGVYHFANPGQDVVNMEVDDFLAPRRQHEIEVLTSTLADWKPTRIAVENEAALPSLRVRDFDQTEQLLTTSRSESIQIGYRMAGMLDHEGVYGYDERPGEGEPDYFPLGRVQSFAQENGGMALLGRLIGEVQAMTAQEQAKLPEQSVAQSLILHNTEAHIGAMHDRLHYSLLSIGDGDQQPGAELNAYWYMRNAKMFAKLDMIAQPGDRVLVLAGSGHATWLKHFARRMPGYKLVDALPYVERAAELSERGE